MTGNFNFKQFVDPFCKYSVREENQSKVFEKFIQIFQASKLYSFNGKCSVQLYNGSHLNYDAINFENQVVNINKNFISDFYHSHPYANRDYPLQLLIDIFGSFPFEFWIFLIVWKDRQ